MVHASEIYAQATMPIETVGGVATLGGLEGVFYNIISALLALGGIVSFFMLLAGGFKYLTSAGDPKALQSAGSTITYAIIGLVAVAASFLILVLISEFTGADVVNFRVVIP